MSYPGDDPTQVQAPVAPGGPAEPEPPAPAAPPPGGGDRRIWIIVALLAVIAVLLVLLIVAGDDDGDDTAGDTTTTAVETSTSTSTTEPDDTTTSSTEPSTTTDPPQVTIAPDVCDAAGQNPATPGLAAQTVFDAWTLGDQDCASKLMTDPALAELFTRDGTDAPDEFQGCMEVDQPDPHTDCTFTYPGGSTHYLMNDSATDGWQVFNVNQIAD